MSTFLSNIITLMVCWCKWLVLSDNLRELCSNLNPKLGSKYHNCVTSERREIFDQINWFTLQKHFILVSMMRNGESQLLMMLSYLSCWFSHKHWQNSPGPSFSARDQYLGFNALHYHIWLQFGSPISLFVSHLVFHSACWII